MSSKPHPHPRHSIRSSVADEVFLGELSRRLPYSVMGRSDLLQETVARGLEAEDSGRYDPSRVSPMVYLLAIARLVGYEAYRKARQGQDLRAAGERHTQHALSPHDLVEAEELLALVIRELDSFRPSDRELVFRRFGFTAGWGDRVPFTGTERCRLHRVLAEIRMRLSHK